MAAAVGMILASSLGGRSGKAERSHAVSASMYAGIGMYWLSYSFLAIGLFNNLLGLTPQEQIATLSLFLATWIAVSVLLLFASLSVSIVAAIQALAFASAQCTLLAGTNLGGSEFFVASGVLFFLISITFAYEFVAAILAQAGRRLPTGPALIMNRSADAS